MTKVVRSDVGSSRRRCRFGGDRGYDDWRRMGSAIGLAVLSVAMGTHVAVAQGLGAGAPQIPMAVDLAIVPVGSWADYSVVLSGSPSLTQRYALVKRVGKLHTLELTISGAQFRAGNVVLKVEVDPAAAGAGQRTKSAVMQIGSNAPMALPPGVDQQAQFGSLDPRKWVGDEVIEVPAGNFKTKRYRDVSGEGKEFSYWVSKDVMPFGLVQLEATMADGKTALLRLTGRGKDAHPVVVRPVRPFDAKLLVTEMQALNAPPPAASPSQSPTPPSPLRAPK